MTRRLIVFLILFLFSAGSVFADETALPKEDFDRLREMARQYLKDGELESARENFLKMAEADPTNPEAFRQLGVIDIQLDDAEEAIEHIQTAIKLGAADSRTYYLLGTAYIRYGDLDKAKEAYLVSIEKEPSFMNAYHDLGLIYYRKDDAHLAVEMLEKALALKPDSHRTMLALGLAYIRKDQPERAVGFVTTLREVHEEVYAAQLENVLRAYGQKKNFEGPSEENFLPDVSKTAPKASSKSTGNPFANSSRSPEKMSITGTAQVNMKSVTSEKKGEASETEKKNEPATPAESNVLVSKS